MSYDARRRRRIEDIALVDYTLRCAEAADDVPPLEDAPLILEAFKLGLDPEDYHHDSDG
jgi:hypothetical protein